MSRVLFYRSPTILANQRLRRVQNKCSIVVGLPDLTPTQHAHISGYVSAAKQLQSAGYEQIVIAAVAPPEQLDEFLSSTGAQSEGCITGLADSSGRFTRMLGLDINAPGTELPFSQRYLGIVKDGILTRLVRSVTRASMWTPQLCQHLVCVVGG